MSKTGAWVNLAASFWLHVLSLKPWRPGGGLELFRENYDADGLRPLTEHERDRLPHFATCLNCGLCLAACALLGRPEQELSGPPDLIAQCYSRAPHQSWAAAGEAAAFAACAPCGACEAICPAGVPLREIAAYVARAAEETLGRLGARQEPGANGAS
jgi:succinate dehydrogenase/fumarate reductase-like Fe-S protein